MKKLSILFLTNRSSGFNVLRDNILKCKLSGPEEIELLICDQGSGQDYAEKLKKINAVYHRMNHYNEGIARSLNQLILRSTAEHLFFMSDDIELPEGWDTTLLAYMQSIPQLGILGFEMQDLKLPEQIIHGFPLCHNSYPRQHGFTQDDCQVYGNIMFTRDLVRSIGGFCEEYHPYGLEDADYCFRAIQAGYLCGYVPGLVAKHLGETRDVNKVAIQSNIGLHRWRAQNYHRIGLHEPLPMAREWLI